MRASRLFFTTLRDILRAPTSVAINCFSELDTSDNSGGLFDYLPLGLRVKHKEALRRLSTSTYTTVNNSVRLDCRHTLIFTLSCPYSLAPEVIRFVQVAKGHSRKESERVCARAGSKV